MNNVIKYEGVSMKNYEKLNQSYTLLCDDLLNAVSDLDKTKSYEDYDAGVKTVDAITVILKRLGETAVLEIGEEPQDGEQPADKHEKDIEVNKKEDIVEEVEGKEE